MDVKIQISGRVVRLYQTGDKSVFQFCVYDGKKQHRRSLRTSHFPTARRRVERFLVHILAARVKAKFSGRRIRPSDYKKLLREQNYACAICSVPFDLHKKRAYCADHDHETGKNRGLLCVQCNFMLGHANDEPEVLAKGAHYLRQHSSTEIPEKIWRRKPHQLSFALPYPSATFPVL